MIKELNELGLININQKFFSEYKENKKVNTKDYLRPDTVVTDAVCRVVYILPQKSEEYLDNCILFEEIAENENIDVDLRNYLKKWINPVSETIVEYL